MKYKLTLTFKAFGEPFESEGETIEADNIIQAHQLLTQDLPGMDGTLKIVGVRVEEV